MKQSPNRRSRSRNSGKRQGGRNNFESNGPDVKVRGTAQQVLEKYLALGRDATSSGDRIAAESYFQHAEHYFRIANAEGQGGNNQGRRDRNDGRPAGTGPQPIISIEETAAAVEPAAVEAAVDSANPEPEPAKSAPQDAPSEAVERPAAEPQGEEDATKPARRRRGRPKRDSAEAVSDSESAPA